jgi:holo-[acyl-carrier protein] synthase
MIFGIGTDISEPKRIENKISKLKGLKEDIFTKNEIEYCESKRNKYLYYAVRFAAKEAFFKALGTGWRFGMKFCEVEIMNDSLGKPELILYGKAKEMLEKESITNTYVSLTHTKTFVNAIVILEKL